MGSCVGRMFKNAAAGKFQIAESGNTPQQAEPQAPLPSWVEGDVDNQSGTSRDPRIIGQALRESFLEPSSSDLPENYRRRSFANVGCAGTLPEGPGAGLGYRRTFPCKSLRNSTAGIFVFRQPFLKYFSILLT